MRRALDFFNKQSDVFSESDVSQFSFPGPKYYERSPYAHTSADWLRLWNEANARVSLLDDIIGHVQGQAISVS